MAKYAKINSEGIVTQVVVMGDENEITAAALLNSLNGGEWKKTSESIRKNPAAIGYEYRSDLDAFIPIKPYPSWTLNETTAQWESPVAHPTDGTSCEWDEDNQQWVNCITPPNIN